jgi:hypothetical protein
VAIVTSAKTICPMRNSPRVVRQQLNLEKWGKVPSGRPLAAYRFAVANSKRWIVEGSTDPCRAAPVYHRRLWGSFSRLLNPFEANSYMRLATPQGFSGIAISHL